MTPVENPNERIRELERENARLKRAVDELSVLNDLAREIGASSNLDDILRTIIGRVISSNKFSRVWTSLPALHLSRMISHFS